MRWTRQRRARKGSQGGMNSVSDRPVRVRTALLTILAGTGRDARGPARALAGWARTAKWCGPDAPRLASSRVEMHPAQPGRDASSIRTATVAKVQGSPGRARIRRNPIVQGKPDGRFTCGLLVRFLRTTAGAIGARLSLRPSFFRRAKLMAYLGHIAPRECGRVFGMYRRHCEELLRRSNPAFFFCC